MIILPDQREQKYRTAGAKRFLLFQPVNNLLSMLSFEAIPYQISLFLAKIYCALLSLPACSLAFLMQYTVDLHSVQYRLSKL